MRANRRSLLLAALLGAAIAVPAMAQPPSTVVYPPPCDASRVTKADVDRAHAVYLSGRQYLEESNYDKAISYFNDAYTIDCSRHAILPIIATAYERKGDKAEAVHALEEYLKRDANGPEHETIERRIRNLREQLAQEAPAAASAVSASPAASTSSAPPAVHAEPPTPSASPSASAPPASSAPSPTSTPEVHGPGPWIAVGAGGAVFVAGVAMVVAGLLEVQSASHDCPSRMNCGTDVVSRGNGGRTLSDIGYGVGGAGLAVLGAGLIWHFVEGSSPRGAGSAGGSSAAGGVQMSPAMAPGFAGLTLSGSL